MAWFTRSTRMAHSIEPAACVRLALLWEPLSGSFRLGAAVLLVLFAIYGAIYLNLTAMRAAADPINDFFGLWSAGRFLTGHPAAQVYDPAALHAAQVALGMAPQIDYPFPYPPSFLLVLGPLGQLPYWTAYAVAIGSSLLFFVWATVGRQWRSAPALAALLAPTTTLVIVAGQTGCLEAALLAGGFRLAGKRPVVAGILLGLLTYKPQIGILVPVALLAARLWRTIAAACITAAVLVVASGAVFGSAIWTAWVGNMIGYAHQFSAENSEIAYLMPTVAERLVALGAAPAQAMAGQALAALAAAAAVWRCFRSGPTSLGAAALFAATFLATPHAFVYDMPVVATAVLWVVADAQRKGEPFASSEILVLILALIAPITLAAGPTRFPLATVSLTLLVVLITRRIARLHLQSLWSAPSSPRAIG